MPAATVDIEDDDPVIAEYDIFVTPDLQEQIYLLQFLNRAPDQPFSQLTRCSPTEMRIKDNSGFIEVDVPVNVHQSFNKPMGVKWGEAIRKTKEQGQKAWGISGGFERVAPPRQLPNNRAGGTASATTPGPNSNEDDSIDDYLRNFDDANEKGHVLNTQTLGGQLLKDDSVVAKYMVGTFRDRQLHLTRLNGIVQMRTQFSHLDATSQLDAIARRREKESQEGAKPTEPKAMTQTVKKQTEGDSRVKTTRDFLFNTHLEQWTKLRYYDEETDEAFSAYADRLFVQDTASVPKLHSTLSNDQYLEAISAPSNDKSGKKKPISRRQMHAIDISDESDDAAEIHLRSALTVEDRTS